jgi:hypothetical protein
MIIKCILWSHVPRDFDFFTRVCNIRVQEQANPLGSVTSNTSQKRTQEIKKLQLNRTCPNLTATVLKTINNSTLSDLQLSISKKGLQFEGCTPVTKSPAKEWIISKWKEDKKMGIFYR